MIVEIILLLLILWIVMSLSHSPQDSHDRQDQLDLVDDNDDTDGSDNTDNTEAVNQKLAYIASILDSLCEDSNVTPEYYLIASDTFTFVENKTTIHLVVQKRSGCLFDDNTLVAASIHELTHILCPGNDHSPLFDKMEQHFLSTAEKLHYYNPKIDIDVDYPRLDVPF